MRFDQSLTVQRLSSLNASGSIVDGRSSTLSRRSRLEKQTVIGPIFIHGELELCG